LDEPELECGCEEKWGSYKPSYRCGGCQGGLQRGSYDAGCFSHRGSSNHGWANRNSYCASGRYGSDDRSNRGSYGVGGVWRGQDKCLDFQNTCPQKCFEREDRCNICQKPATVCKCFKKQDLCLSCQKPKVECVCYKKPAEYKFCREEPECFEEPKYGCYEPEWDCDEPKWGLDQYEPSCFENRCEKKLDLCNLCQKPAIECQCQKKCQKCYQPQYLCRCQKLY
jgi:hypothetical protein